MEETERVTFAPLPTIRSEDADIESHGNGYSPPKSIRGTTSLISIYPNSSECLFGTGIRSFAERRSWNFLSDQNYNEEQNQSSSLFEEDKMRFNWILETCSVVESCEP